jgi:predicted O-linked N-acetylglucosamine transferase (SPINDLY family)
MTPSIEEAFGRATASFRAGNLHGAEHSFKEVLRQDPRHLAALNLLGIVLTHVKKYEEAEPYLRSALQLNPGSDATLYNYGIILKALNRPKEALERFSQALAVNATIAATWNNRGTVLNDIKRYDEAIRDFDRSILLDANNPDAFCNKGKSLFSLKRHQEALAAYERAVALKPDLAEAWLGRGNIFGELKRFDEAFMAYDKALALKPQLAETWLSRANLLLALERYDEAFASYDKVLALEPGLAVAWLGRGNTFFKTTRYQEALAAYDRALALDSALAAALLGRGNVFFETRRDDLASDAYDKALALEPDLAAAWVGRGNVLFRLKRFEDALTAHNSALTIEPELGDAWLGAGNVLFEVKRHEGAASAYDKALELNPTLAAAWLGRGNILFFLKQYEDAVAAYDRALALKPDLTGVEGLRSHAKAQLCDWSRFDPECKNLISVLRNGTPNTGPFQLLAIPSSPEDQLQCARLWAGTHFPPAANPVWRGERYDHERIRVAYLSADFRQHPVAMCMAGVFERHDKSLFEMTAISCGPNDDSEIRQRVQASFERFIDTQTYSDEQIANLVKELEIDILVDLMGYTTDSRTGVLARRAAPIQVNYFGYSGTMGVDYIDYLIGDQTIIPNNQRQFYSENIVYLPHSFLPPDHKRRISDKSFPRPDAGLPEKGFVFCCFNNHYKITPGVFDSWMRILSKVEGSVLWLLETNPTAESNLRKEATARHVNPERLVFAGHMPPADHLARHHLADLFLDTLPYNAHTTASEALWTGLPVLTLSGETFAGRVAASLLTAIQMPDLITTTAQDYERLAIDLATNPEQLKALKRRLAENRHSTPLFDTASFTRHIEKAYTTMHRRHLDGLARDDIAVLG